MARNSNARPAGDLVKVKKLASLGYLSFREIAERTKLPLGTVCRYTAQLRRQGEIEPRRGVVLMESSDG